MPKIIIHHPDGTQVKYGLNGKAFTIGRAENNDIVLRDGASSSHHAVLKLGESGDFAVTDLESTNHTRVNGTKVTSQVLVNGDVIQFGDTQAVYESEVVVERSGGEAVTQPYGSPPPPVAPPAAVVRAAGPAQPYVIQRPVSTMGGRRRRASGQGDGCFALLLLCLLLPFLFVVGVVARHYQEPKGDSIVDVARQALVGK